MKTRKVAVALLVLVIFGVVAFTSSAFAADTTINSGINGVSSISSGTDAASAVTSTLDTWIKNLRIIGVVVAVFGIVIGAIIFSVSLGNAQRRGLGTTAMITAAVGIIILIKAPQLAGYFINQN